jgi:predicted DNA-binding ribbon-helix-helix protein
MDRPQKLNYETKKYSFLVDETHLESLKIIAQRRQVTTATLVRQIIEDHVMSSPIFNDD